MIKFKSLHRWKKIEYLSRRIFFFFDKSVPKIFYLSAFNSSGCSIRLPRVPFVANSVVLRACRRSTIPRDGATGG